MSNLITRSVRTHRGSRSKRFVDVRTCTEHLAEPLSAEDQTVQSMPDASPTKWHLAHTTWFFETFVLAEGSGGYKPVHPAYRDLFNSYYQAVGHAFPRPRRGLLSRPTLREVHDYRRVVADRVDRFLGDASEVLFHGLAPIVEIGLHHEQQHQELILTDLKHAFADNPLSPRYCERSAAASPQADAPLRWFPYEGGLLEFGAKPGGFAFDNERPRHAEHVPPFAIAGRLATCGEYAAFIEDGGYSRPDLWLSDGWDARCRLGWEAPLYWSRSGSGAGERWQLFTLSGKRDVDPREPVCHVSFYEADAYARWAGARLAREAEWECAAAGVDVAGNFADQGVHHPAAASAGDGTAPVQLFGDVWEWTASAYLPYPGYRAPSGALGEYNGKFMCNQIVLRGGSCASPQSHLRATYRNFFGPEARWQFSGIRLAKDA